MTVGVEVDSGMSVHQCGWLTEFEAECIDFPNSEYKDQIDPMSQYLKTVRQRRQKYVPIVSPIVNEFSRESYWMDNDDTQGADIWA